MCSHNRTILQYEVYIYPLHKWSNFYGLKLTYTINYKPMQNGQIREGAMVMRCVHGQTLKLIIKNLLAPP